MRFHNSDKVTVGLLRMTGKNRSYGWTLAGTLVIVCFLLLGGCFGKGTQEDTRFYLLLPISGISSVEHTPTDDEAIGLAIGPVRVREHLNRPQMVTRTEENEILIDNFHSWGEPLDRNFTIVLAANLSELLATDKIVIFPWRTRPTDLEYQVIADVIRFDGELGGEVSLIAHYYIWDWAMEGSEGKDRRIGTWKSSFSRQTADESFETLVATMSELVGDFSREVAEKLKGVSR